MLELNADSFGQVIEAGEPLVSPGGHQSGYKSLRVHQLSTSLGPMHCIVYCETSTAEVKWNSRSVELTDLASRLNLAQAAPITYKEGDYFHQKMGNFLSKLMQLERGLTWLHSYYNPSLEALETFEVPEVKKIATYTELEERLATEAANLNDLLPDTKSVKIYSSLLFARNVGDLTIAAETLDRIFGRDVHTLEQHLLQKSLPLLTEMYRSGEFKLIA